ncbi:Hint domain-containing protein [Roseobacter sp. HKCCA0434]|uniref:Hint domain-containing protein n=1 Tax=Roseobacter sp. HKCCA0434 TaxID=3079297 RepID=UPI002905A648|nr:Hint domain-containing protein [Roseobacter sp. HKCCA0434]
MANIYTYSVYTDAELNYNGSFTSLDVPTTGPRYEIHVTDDDTIFASTGTSDSTQQIGYLYDTVTGTYLRNGKATISSQTDYATAGGTTVTVWTLQLDFPSGTEFLNIISPEDQAAASGQTATGPAPTFATDQAFTDLPTWGESLTNAAGGPSLTGNDSIFGQGGDDSLRGGNGKDTISGAEGNDSLFGDAGNDSISGGLGEDSLEGGRGNDSLTGGEGNDQILGGRNDDTVVGGDGDDTLFGDGTEVRNPQQDVARFVFNRNNIDSSGSPDGGAGTEAPGESIIYKDVAVTADGVSIDARFTLVETFAPDGSASSMPVDLNNDDTTDPNLVILNDGILSPVGSTTGGHKARVKIEFLIGDGQANSGDLIVVNGTFVFRDLDETTPGGSTIDVERVTVKSSEFSNFSLSTNTSVSFSANGDETEWTFSGTRPNNQVTLTAEEQEENQVALDFLNRDTIEVVLTARNVNSGFTFGTRDFTIPVETTNIRGEGADSVLGGAGNDTLYGAGSSDTLDGGTGDDLVDGGFQSDLINLSDGFGVDTIRGGEGSGEDQDTLSAEGLTTNGVEIVISDYTDGNFTGTAQERGTSDISQFSEIENIVLSNQADIWDSTATAENVTVSGLSGNDTITTGAGDDLISGGDGADSIDAGDGDDTATGGSGNDTFIAGLGNDSFSGGDNTDRLILTDTFGTDVFDGGGGNDTIDASGLVSHGVDIVFTGDEAGTFSDQTNAAGTFTSVNGLVFSSQDDSLDASGQSSFLPRVYNLGDGDDRFVDGAARHFIIGGAGQDSFSAGAGGNDNLSGGLGDDVFDFIDGASTNGGGDTITITGGEDPGDGDIDSLLLRGLTAADGSRLRLSDVAFDPADSESGSFTLEDGTVVNFSEIENVVCFAGEAHIVTPLGPRAARSLRVGDLVVTRDCGVQPIRWIGRRTVSATGSFAPIEFAPGTLGNTRTLRVSPQHRMLVRDSALRLRCGADEMLIAARHMIDGDRIRQVEGGEVEYVHMMFDRHQIIYADGVASESFHPGKMSFGALDPANRAELFALFPELAVTGPPSYGPSARQTLRGGEWAATSRLSA